MGEIRWTPEQVRAIRSTEDTLLVANAGTGKTTTVVGKILWLLGMPFGVEEETGEPLAPPPDPCGLDEVAAITFTEKAAYDLKRQLRAAVARSPRGEALRWEVDRASVGTIHAFCAELLREHALRLGIDPAFEVLDAEEAGAEQDRMIRELVLERLEAGDPAARELLRRFSLAGQGRGKGAVDHLRTALADLRWHGDRYAAWLAGDGSRAGGSSAPEAGAEGLSLLDLPTLQDACEAWDERDGESAAICDALLRLAREARARWERHLEEESSRDFDALILGARDLLTGPEAGAALAAIRSRYRILVIDEFQDTDFAQRDIALAIGRGASRPQLFLVGDPKQSIYRFRGADISVWNAVETDFRADGRVLELSRNFRSAPPVVAFVNRAARAAVEETGEAVAEELPGSRVAYSALEPAVEDHEAAGVEWLETEGGARAAKRRDEVGGAVAARIAQMVGSLPVRDPETGERRPLAHRDVAILYRTRTGLPRFENALVGAGIPYFVAGASRLGERQEILDVMNALRLLEAPGDDLRAFGFLRSPFVGLRDETIARLRLLSRRAPLLVQARRFLEEGTPFEAPEHPEIARIEREALARGLDALEALRALAPRIPLDELIEELLERTGYPLHLLLMDRAEEVLANLQSLVRFAAGHRSLDLSAFFEAWDRRTAGEAGIPQAPLYSKVDDVVTLSTIHGAKGLEWPVVFLVGVADPVVRHRTNDYWSDRELGPVYCLRSADRGPRSDRIHERELREAAAEEARLLYVATTRARDRLVVVGPRGGGKGYDRWLEAGVAEEDRDRVEVRPAPALPAAYAPPASPSLEWLDAWEAEEPPALVRPLEPPRRLRWLRSATELMTEAEDREAWKRRYRHGVLAVEEFAGETEPSGGEGRPDAEGERLPARARGVLIHGVLERLEEARELARVLEEAIGELEDPALEALLAPGSGYREALEEEIRRVVESQEWAAYTAGEPGRDYWNELPFLHLRGERDGRMGAFDLYRREADPRAAGPEGNGPALVVDFKTHPIPADRAAEVAAGYEIQARVYRAAAEIAGPVSVRLHFTRPNVAVEME